MYPWPQVPTDPSLVPVALSPMVVLTARLWLLQVYLYTLPAHPASTMFSTRCHFENTKQQLVQTTWVTTAFQV